MKERPVLFNGDMVRAILDGRKTQTRRMVKPQRSGPAWTVKPTQEPRYARHSHDWWLPTGTAPYSALPSCPYGAAGDRLWVRETFRLFDKYQECGCSDFPCNCPSHNSPIYRASNNDCEDKWTPSIHMPRSASRILLEITNVRVERLGDISDIDASSEGCSLADMKSGDRLADVFKRLWSSIYGAESWQANPWVWVIEFRRVKP
ncbi:hypothetical protein RDT67_00980 [Serratia fonticola]|uniref:Morphogenetic protein n=1 Tax=Serratia fonticola TaxID=47917 RepID=A0AAJ1Y8E1_SERFO|nr:hypothetical protein [Serratia fonticola]MDQ9124994.1 hypothetical protein [Serratia fonticola]